jgi:DNA-binding NarL/FixJ family response regulator
MAMGAAALPSGYPLKDSPRDVLIAAVEGAAAGKTYIDPAVAGRLFAHIADATPAPSTSLLHDLTDRERQVLALLGRGFSNSDIATELHMAEGTVRNHVSAILSKLTLPTAHRRRSWHCGWARRCEARVKDCSHVIPEIEQTCYGACCTEARPHELIAEVRYLPTSSRT